MREQIEHASMLLEWIRCHDPDFERFLKTYLFTEGSILQEEKPQLPKESAVAGPRGAEAVARPAYRATVSRTAACRISTVRPSRQLPRSFLRMTTLPNAISSMTSC
jgi:hypothetical protein